MMTGICILNQKKRECTGDIATAVGTQTSP